MSDREVIIQLLRKVESRIRMNRLVRELSRSLSIVLFFLIALKLWDLFHPLTATTIISVVTACLLFFAGFALWRTLQRGTLEQAAVSVDHQAGLKDEIQTAFWFINHPRSSEWVDKQIQRAAIKGRTIDVYRTYPRMLPHSSYSAAVAILLFLGLNFVPLPFNHNWLLMQAAPAGEYSSPGNGDVSGSEILKGLAEIADDLQQAELLEDVSEALKEGNLNEAADELRNASEQLENASELQMDELRDALESAADGKQEGLEALMQALAETAEALDDANAVDQGLEKAAQELNELAGNIKNDPPPGSLQSREQVEEIPGGATPSEVLDPGQAPGSGLTESTQPLDATLELEMKLQAEALIGIDGDDSQQSPDEEEEKANKQESSRLEYRNTQSEFSPAEKDLLNQTGIPRSYDTLIKSYFQALRAAPRK